MVSALLASVETKGKIVNLKVAARRLPLLHTVVLSSIHKVIVMLCFPVVGNCQLILRVKQVAMLLFAAVENNSCDIGDIGTPTFGHKLHPKVFLRRYVCTAHWMGLRWPKPSNGPWAPCLAPKTASKTKAHVITRNSLCLRSWYAKGMQRF